MKFLFWPFWSWHFDDLRESCAVYRNDCKLVSFWVSLFEH
uniref:Uncharacterized protein n=1 Tax=Rhizophora mucronata TaxID=61149 RepID=A0A2P2N7G0_RHIMU